MSQPSDRSKPRDRLAALPAERRAALLDPAEAEFAAHGFAGASLNRILAEAGMSKGQAYYYIADKSELYAAVAERALARLLAAVDGPSEPPRSAEAFWTQVASFFGQITDVLMRDERLGALARGIYEGPETEAALAAPMGRVRAELDCLVVQGQSVGAIRTDLPQSLLVSVLLATTQALDRWFAEHAPTLTPSEAMEMNDRAIGLIRTMASPPNREE